VRRKRMPHQPGHDQVSQAQGDEPFYYGGNSGAVMAAAIRLAGLKHSIARHAPCFPTKDPPSSCWCWMFGAQTGLQAGPILHQFALLGTSTAAMCWEGQTPGSGPAQHRRRVSCKAAMTSVKGLSAAEPRVGFAFAGNCEGATCSPASSMWSFVTAIRQRCSSSWNRWAAFCSTCCAELPRGRRAKVGRLPAQQPGAHQETARPCRTWRRPAGWCQRHLRWIGHPQPAKASRWSAPRLATVPPATAFMDDLHQLSASLDCRSGREKRAPEPVLSRRQGRGIPACG